MCIKIITGIAAIVVVGLIGTVLISQSRFNSQIEKDVESLLEKAKTDDQVFKKEDLEGLPEPVKGYFNKVMKEGQPYIDTVRLKQRGEFRVGGDNSSPWRSFTATQHYSINPPGFIWDAEIDFFPLVPVRVVDRYKNGEGSLQGKLLSAINVADAKPSPEMNSGELLRYLGEAVWFPTALLPDQGVQWESIDNNTARATIEDQGIQASALFHFNEENEVVKIHAEKRYRQEDNSSKPWTGYFEDYEKRNGILIPLKGEVGWDLEEGYLSYWKGSIKEIEYGITKEDSQ